MNNRSMHGSISSTTSSTTGGTDNTGAVSTGGYIPLPTGEPLLAPGISDPIAVPVPPPPSPEVPGYILKEMNRDFVSTPALAHCLIDFN